jgi:hypothetical protein
VGIYFDATPPDRLRPPARGTVAVSGGPREIGSYLAQHRDIDKAPSPAPATGLAAAGTAAFPEIRRAAGSARSAAWAR